MNSLDAGGVVVAPNRLASAAGRRIMSQGGNAVDGAVAAIAVQGVVAPETCGIGGDLFALVYRPDRAGVTALNASGRAGSNVDPEQLASAGHSRVPPLAAEAVTAPGCVDGFVALLGEHGRLSLSEVLRPAIELASEGFHISDELADELQARRDEVIGHPSAEGLYPACPGRWCRRPMLSETLAEVAEGGREAFYGGRAARAIVRLSGGLLTAGDLARPHAQWVTPLGAEVFGKTGWTIPPNSQGYLTLAALSVFEMLDPPPDPDRLSWWHLLIESYRSVAWERDQVVADSRYAPHPPEWLVDRARLEERAARISSDRAGRWPSPLRRPGGTAYLCAMDSQGMGVSMIQSNFWGMGVGAGDCGFFLHNRGHGFSLRLGHPNRLGPGKRPLHTLSPTLWTDKDGNLVGLLGTRGGDLQPQLLTQMAARLFGLGEAPAFAQAAPRWTMRHFGPDQPSQVLLEADVSPKITAGLARMGHSVEITSRRRKDWGPVSVIVVDEGGNRLAASDPRAEEA